ncbi:hypothetical protein ECTOBSL9_0951 [Ectothiorhodospira sp. BSL-9]|nr:hypothetical protein ECTOBSL9_0951 [Ectothiorhodospira sp. BSL-9]
MPAIACDAPEVVELSSESDFSDSSGREAARQAAIRNGVVDALQRAAGAEIARSAQTATTSSLTSLDRETRDHLVIRSGGRVLGWQVIDEEDRTLDGMEGTTIVVHLHVKVCPSMQEPQALVVAIGEPVGIPADLSGVIRARLAQMFEASDSLAVVREAPVDTYHDLRIELDHAVEVRNVDHSEKAAILGRFRDPEMIDEGALRFQLVSVTTTLSAVRFVDRRTISETIERRRRVALDVSPDNAIAELLVEGATLASTLLIDQLDAGALDYARR